MPQSRPRRPGVEALGQTFPGGSKRRAEKPLMTGPETVQTPHCGVEAVPVESSTSFGTMMVAPGRSRSVGRYRRRCLPVPLGAADMPAIPVELGIESEQAMTWRPEAVLLARHQIQPRLDPEIS